MSGYFKSLDVFASLLVPPGEMTWEQDGDSICFFEPVGQAFACAKSSHGTCGALMGLGGVAFVAFSLAQAAFLLGAICQVASWYLATSIFYLGIYAVSGEQGENCIQWLLESSWLLLYARYLLFLCHNIMQAFYFTSLTLLPTKAVEAERRLQMLDVAPPSFEQSMASVHLNNNLPFWFCEKHSDISSVNRRSIFADIPYEIAQKTTQLEATFPNTVLYDYSTNSAVVEYILSNQLTHITILGYMGKQLDLASTDLEMVVIRDAPHLEGVSLGNGIQALAIADAPILQYFSAPQNTKKLEIKRCPILEVRTGLWGQASEGIESIVIYGCNQLSHQLQVPIRSLRELSIVCCRGVRRLRFSEKDLDLKLEPPTRGVNAALGGGANASSIPTLQNKHAATLQKVTLAYLPELATVYFPGVRSFTSALEEVKISCCANFQHIGNWGGSRYPIEASLKILSMRYLPNLDVPEAIPPESIFNLQREGILVDFTGSKTPANSSAQRTTSLLSAKQGGAQTQRDGQIQFWGGAEDLVVFLKEEESQKIILQELVINSLITAEQATSAEECIAAVIHKGKKVVPEKMSVLLEGTDSSLQKLLHDDVLDLNSLKEFECELCGSFGLQNPEESLNNYFRKAPNLQKISIYIHEEINLSNVQWPASLEDLEIHATFSPRQQLCEKKTRLPLQVLPTTLKRLYLSGVGIFLGDGSSDREWSEMRDLHLQSVLCTRVLGESFPALRCSMNSIFLDAVFYQKSPEEDAFTPRELFPQVQDKKISVQSLTCMYPMPEVFGLFGLSGEETLSNLFADVKQLHVSCTEYFTSINNWAEHCMFDSLESLSLNIKVCSSRSVMNFNTGSWSNLRNLSIKAQEKYFGIQVQGLHCLPSLQRCFLKGVALAPSESSVSLFSKNQQSLVELEMYESRVVGFQGVLEFFQKNSMNVWLHYENVLEGKGHWKFKKNVLQQKTLAQEGEYNPFTTPQLWGEEEVEHMEPGLMAAKNIQAAMLRDALVYLQGESFTQDSREQFLKTVEKGFTSGWHCLHAKGKNALKNADFQQETERFVRFWQGMREQNVHSIASQNFVFGGISELLYLAGKSARCCNSECCPMDKQNAEVAFLTRMFSDCKALFSDAMAGCTDRQGLRFLALLGQMRLYAFAKEKKWKQFSSDFYQGLLPLFGFEREWKLRNWKAQAAGEVELIAEGLVALHDKAPFPPGWSGSFPTRYVRDFGSQQAQTASDQYVQLRGSTHPSILACNYVEVLNYMSIFSILDRFVSSTERGGAWDLPNGLFFGVKGSRWADFSKRYISQSSDYNKSLVWNDFLSFIPRHGKNTFQGMPPSVNQAFVNMQKMLDNFIVQDGANPLDLLEDSPKGLLAALFAPIYDEQGALEYELGNGYLVQTRIFLLLLLKKTEGRGISFEGLLDFFSVASGLGEDDIPTALIPSTDGAGGSTDHDAFLEVFSQVHKSLMGFALFLCLDLLNKEEVSQG